MTEQNYETEIAELLEQLTLDEKISMIHGCGFFQTAAVPRLGIPSLKMSDGPMGVRMEFPDDSWIPVGNSDDLVSYFPSNSALAATWNPGLARKAGRAMGEEFRGRGKDVALAPGINIKRDPLCGRNFEYMSEDPHLITTMTVPFIEGLQKNDVAACVKHFAVNSQETNRFYVDEVVDERTLREIYFPGFRAAVRKAGTYSLMNAYNMLNGTHCSENQALLNDVLRDEWKYDGTVISDWGSVHTTVGAANASLDLEMSVTTDFDDYFLAQPLKAAVLAGEVSEAVVDAKVANILRMMFRLKMIGPHASERKAGAYNTPEHRELILDTAREAIVLLKNEEKQLPLSGEELRGKRIAVIGHNAEHRHAAGGGSGEIKALYEISPLMGLKAALGGSAEVVYAQGYYIPGSKDVNEVNWQEASLERQVMGEENADSEEQKKLRAEIEENRARLLQEACELAKSADYVIFVGGLNHDYDVEGRDRSDMKLPYGQDELLNAVLEIQPDTVVVMVAGSPVEMPWLSKVKSLVWCYYSGMETGHALADILLGKVNPSAKLPETFPVSYADTVTARNGQFGKEKEARHEEGIFVGYRYYEKEEIAPAFPFGYGLSYTDFEISDLKLKVCECAQPGLCTEENEEDIFAYATVQLRNVGDREGAEVIQCYVSDPQCSVARPVKELKDYVKEVLAPGQQREVTLLLSRKAFAFYDVEAKAFRVEAGTYRILVGNASDACELQAELSL